MAVFKHLNNWAGEDSGFIEKIRHESNAGGGVSSYDELTDKPSINDVILQGNTTLDDLNIQVKGDYALKEEIPTKIGELENDLGYVTEVPTKISELENDANYINSLPEDLATIDDVENMIKNKADKGALDNKVSKDDVLTELDVELDKTDAQWYNAKAIDQLVLIVDEAFTANELETRRYTDERCQGLVAKSDRLDEVAIDVDKEDNQWYSAKAIDGMGTEFGEVLTSMQQQIDSMPGDEELQAFGQSVASVISNKVDKSKHITVDVNDFDLSERHDEDAWYNANMCNEIFAKFDEMLNEVEDKIPSDISELKNDKSYATTYDVNTAVAKLVGSAPETLDTIEELATGLAANRDMIELLNDSIVDKANKTDLEGLATEEYVNDIVTAKTVDVNTKLEGKANSADLSTVATSGNYNDLIDKPTTLGQFTNDVGYLTEVPETYATKAEVTEVLDTKANKTDIPDVSKLLTQAQADAAVKDAKDYTDERIADLIDTAPDTMDTLGEIAEILGNNNDVTVALMETIGTKADKADLANVATSGSYNDLSDKPEIPTIPTNVSSFTNDSGYITSTVNENLVVNKSLYLGATGTSVNDAKASRIYFGTPTQTYSYLSSNTSGAFSFSRGAGNIVIYPQVGTNNCIMSDCDSDLGRPNNPWKDLYVRQNICNGTDSVAVSDLIAAVNTIAALQSTITELETRIADLEAHHAPEGEVVE